MQLAEQEQPDSEWSGKSPSPQTKEEEQSKQVGGADEEKSTSFLVKRYREKQKEGPQKKSEKMNPPLDPIMLIEGDLDEIGDKVRDIKTKLLQQFEQKDLESLVTFQKDLRELQIQTSRIQVGTGQVSTAQTSLGPRTGQATKMVRSTDLQAVTLPKGSQSTKSADDKVIVSTLKNIVLNLTALPNEYLHMLQTGVTTQLRAWEKHTLILINEYRVNNEKIFAKKTNALKAKETIQVQSIHLAVAVAKVCKIVLELQIPQEVPLEAKIRKLAAGVREAKTEVARVQFQLNLKFIELELKSQPLTLPKVREQCEAAVKDGVPIVDAMVMDCTTLFEQAMEEVTTLQEDLKLQRLKTETHELQNQYDEVQMMTHTMSTMQCLAKVQEGKHLLAQVEVTQKKEAVLKAQLDPWLEDSYQVSTNIQQKLENLQLTQSKVKWDIKGPATEHLVDQVRQEAMQSMVVVAVVQVELGDPHSKISVPAKCFEDES